jgi:hypothetical protein
MNDGVVWLLPALVFLSAVRTLTVERGPWNVGSAAFLMLISAYPLITEPDIRPPPAELLTITAFAAFLLTVDGVRIRNLGADCLLDRSRPWPGQWSACRTRRQVDRRLRRRPDDVSETQDAGAPVVAAARDAGRGEVTAAVARLDRLLASPDRPRSWPDASLGLILYHRTLYSALAAAAGHSPPETTRWRNDVDVARTLLPDLRRNVGAGGSGI